MSEAKVNWAAFYKAECELLRQRVAELEAARDGAILAIETWEKREQKQYERVSELEAALREIAERRAPGDREGTISRSIARRALGGGEE